MRFVINQDDTIYFDLLINRYDIFPNGPHDYSYPNDLREIIYLMNHNEFDLEILERFGIKNLDNFRTVLKLRKFDIKKVIEEYISIDVLVKIINSYFEY